MTFYVAQFNGWNNYAQSYRIRPVVTLDYNVQLEKDGKDTDGTDIWRIK